MTNSFEIIFDQLAIQKLSEKITLIMFDVRGQEFESWLKEDAGEQTRKATAFKIQNQYSIYTLKFGAKIIY